MLALAVVPILVFADEMPAADFSGLVAGVIDGDSLTAMNQGKAENVRLLGIDGPEKKQPFGARAKAVHLPTGVRESRHDPNDWA